jgi:hypothetical protein
VRAGALGEGPKTCGGRRHIDETGRLLALLASASGQPPPRASRGARPRSVVDGVRACLRRGTAIWLRSGGSPAPRRTSAPVGAPVVRRLGPCLSGRALPEAVPRLVVGGGRTWRIACLARRRSARGSPSRGASDRVEGELRVLELPTGWLA